MPSGVSAIPAAQPTGSGCCAGWRCLLELGGSSSGGCEWKCGCVLERDRVGQWRAARKGIGGGSAHARLLSGSLCGELEPFRDGSEACGCDVRLEWGEGEDLADERLAHT